MFKFERGQILNLRYLSLFVWLINSRLKKKKGKIFLSQKKKEEMGVLVILTLNIANAPGV